MKQFAIPLLTILVVACLVFSSCRPKPPEIPPYPEEMPCGMVVDLSGPYAEIGKRLRAGAEAGVTQMNGWGGIRNMLSMNLTLIVADDGGSPAQAKAEAERLIAEEEVIYIIGSWPTASAVSEVAEEYKIPFVCILDMEPITERGLEFTFRTTPSAELTASQVVSGMTKSAEETGMSPPESCFLMYVPDDQGNAVAEAFKAHAEASGIQIVGEEIVDKTANSFSSQLSVIEAAEPDLLFTCNYTNDAIILYREMMERQTYFPYGVYSWGEGLEDPAFYEALPQEAYEYGFVHEAADPQPQQHRYYAWVNEAVQAELGYDWNDPQVAGAYHTIWLLKEALERMTPVRRVSRPGTHTGMEFSLDLDKFRSNLQYALSNLAITRADVEKLQLPDGSPFLPALQLLLLDRVEFDNKGQMAYATGIISQNIDGTRWPLFPESQRIDGSPSLILPIPNWHDR